MKTRERLLWLAITLLSSITVGLIGAILSSASAHSLVEAIVAGTVTFAGAEAMLLAILKFVLAQPSEGKE